MAVGSVAEVCAEAASAQDAVRAARREQPDVCFVGRELPGSALAAARALREVSPDAVVVVLATKAHPDDLLACLRAGARGYIPASTSEHGLRRVIERAAAGEAVIPRDMVLELVREVQLKTSRPQGALTTRETQILGLLRRGYATPAIAHRLGISPVTVRRHISNARRKTGQGTRAALVSAMGTPAHRQRSIPPVPDSSRAARA
jgi:DNA-binding NarL/FixJ family response regulator